MFVVKENLHFRVLPLNNPGDGVMETQGIKIKLQGEDLDVLNVYIPPNARLEANEFKYYLDQLHENYIVCGDLNGRHWRWEPSANVRENNTGKVINDLLDEVDHLTLATPPDLPTHTGGHTGHTSTLDLSLCSANLLPRTLVTTLPDLGSDHLPVRIKLSLRPERRQRGKRRKWILNVNDTVWTTWQSTIAALPPRAEGTLEAEYEEYVQGLQMVSTEIFKKTSDKLRNKLVNPAWTEKCSRAAALRKRAKRRMEKTPSMGNKREYRRLHAQAIRTILEEERNFWRTYMGTITPKTPIKEIWDKVNKLRGTSSRKEGPLLRNDRYIHHKEEKAAIFNTHFQGTMSSDNVNVYPQQVLEKIADMKAGGSYPECDVRFTMQEIQNSLKSLATGKGYGLDDVPNEFLQKLPRPKIQELLGLFNRSWREGLLPSAWKIGLLIPILKPGKSPELPSSYRPIALLQCIGKLMENMVGERAKYLAEKENLLSPSQYGFRTRRSTIDPIIELEHEIRVARASGKITVVVFFDLKAAFDSVDHTRLLHALAMLGIGGNMLKWLENFLSNRKICTLVEDHTSNPLDINQGVPQGSGLSTVLFTLLLSDLPNVSPVRSKEFCDDLAY